MTASTETPTDQVTRGHCDGCYEVAEITQHPTGLG